MDEIRQWVLENVMPRMRGRFGGVYGVPRRLETVPDLITAGRFRYGSDIAPGDSFAVQMAPQDPTIPGIVQSHTTTVPDLIAAGRFRYGPDLPSETSAAMRLAPPDPQIPGIVASRGEPALAREAAEHGSFIHGASLGNGMDARQQLIQATREAFAEAHAQLPQNPNAYTVIVHAQTRKLLQNGFTPDEVAALYTRIAPGNLEDRVQWKPPTDTARSMGLPY